MEAKHRPRRKLAALLKKGKRERGAELSIEQFESELRERRGGVHW